MNKTFNLSTIALKDALWLTAGLILAVSSIIIVSYGADSIVMGVHDTFHDFRHAIGMPCH
ncbi:MAG: CbtB-domain containing protein [Candidatus Desulfatibia sp.]|uniref:CbtB domain-containing protein n=1 Tax=Candidatus Desulfatibia sp. TaxID=3101189 RepID=UPI002F33ADDF